MPKTKSMGFFKKYDLNPKKVLTYSALALAALALFVFLFDVVIGPIDRMGGNAVYKDYAEESVSMVAPDYDGGTAMGAPGFPSRDIRESMPSTMPHPGGRYVPGVDAEEFEVKDYTATFESEDITYDCSALSTLARRDTVFLSSYLYKQGCSYTFKVKKENVERVIVSIQNMDPIHLTENTYTIKNTVSDYTSQIDILTEKLAVIDATLEKAIAAYDEISVLATETQDADALARIIDGKINVLERLTMDRTNLNVELERLAQAKAEELDRLDFTYFSVSAYENRYVNGDAIAAAWKVKVQQLILNINAMVSNITIGLFGLLVFLAPFLIYGLILLLVAKYGWKYVKAIWNQ